MGSEVSTSFYHKSDSWFLPMLVFCSWEDRSNTCLVSRNFHKFQQDDLFWKWMCCRLDTENNVYSPVIVPVSSTFRSLFEELFHLRHMWDAAPAVEGDGTQRTQANDKKKISVYARFCPIRPKSKALEKSDENHAVDDQENQSDSVEITLPLHQRLAMIKMSNRLTSNRQALQVLTSEGGKKKDRLTHVASYYLLKHVLRSERRLAILLNVISEP